MRDHVRHIGGGLLALYEGDTFIREIGVTLGWDFRDRDEFIARYNAAAEPADAGRDAVAVQSRRNFVDLWRLSLAGNGHDVIANRNTVRRFVGIIDELTRPPSEAAAVLTKTAVEDIMAKYLGRSSRLYLYMQADIRTELASQQAVKP